MKIFVEVVDSGGFSSAARTLGLAPSSVKRRIDALETDLGVLLLSRSTRHLVLTDAGDVFYQRCISIIAAVQSAREVIRPNDKEPEGEVRVSAFSSYGRMVLSPLMPGFLQAYPNISLSLDLDNNLVDLYRDPVDVAIRIGRPKDSLLRMRRIGSNDLLLVASHDYLVKHGMPDTPDQLKNHNCLILAKARQATFWHFRRLEETCKVSVTGNIRSKGGESLLEATLQHTGITMLSRWLIRQELESGQLLPVMSDWESGFNDAFECDIFLVFTQEKSREPHVRAFVDYVVERLQEATY